MSSMVRRTLKWLSASLYTPGTTPWPAMSVGIGYWLPPLLLSSSSKVKMSKLLWVFAHWM